MSKRTQAKNPHGLKLGFGILICIFVLFGTFVLYDIHKVTGLSLTLYNHPLVVSNAALQANVSIAKIHRNMKDVVLFHSTSRIQESIEAVNKEEQQVYFHLDIVKKNILGEKGRALEKEARYLFDKWKPIRNEVIGLVHNNQREIAADITIGKGASHVAVLEENMMGLTKYARKKASQFAADAQQLHTRLNATSIVFLITGVLASILVGFLTLRLTGVEAKKLQESEAHYRSLIESQSDLVCRFTPDGEFVFVNDMYCQFFDRPQMEVIGSKWQPLPVDDDVEIINEKLSALSPANPTVSIENRVRSGKGEIHWIHFINNGFFDSQGNLLEIQSVGRDITERKLAEEKLIAAEANLKNTFAISPGIISKANIVTGYFLEVSPVVTKILGFSVKEFTSRPINEFIHPDDIQRTTDEISAQLQGKEVMYFENRYLCKDGSYKWLAWNGTLADENGIVTAIGSDITERKETERAIIDSEELFRAVFEQAGGYCMILQPTDTGVPIVFDANEAACTIHGYTRKEMIGRPVADLDDEEGKRLCLERTKYILSGKTLDIETIHVRKDGSTFPVSVFAKVVRIGDKSPLILSTEFDISDKKEAEAEKQRLEVHLQQAQKMEAIGTLAGGIAHDFNNILSSVIGFTELALEDAGPMSDQQDNLNEVLTAGLRAKELVQHILAFARQADEPVKPMEFGLIVTEVLKMIRSTIPTTIEIVQSVVSKDMVMASPSQMHQVVLNLCTNAAHAMQDGGGILEVVLKSVTLGNDSQLLPSGLAPDNYLELTISDTGTGIDPAIIDKIFEPYFTTKNVGEGTGLGLAMVKGIIESNNGQIGVSSVPNEKTSFVIYMPVICEWAAEESHHGFEVGPLVRNEHILLVDDEPPIVRMGERLLAGLGYTVTAKISSLEALELFEEFPDRFDLVITDMTMPKMTGDVLSKELRKIRPDIPIILCTGYSSKINKNSAKDMGINAYTSKPFTKSDIVKTISEVLATT